MLDYVQFVYKFNVADREPKSERNLFAEWEYKKLSYRKETVRLLHNIEVRVLYTKAI